MIVSLAFKMGHMTLTTPISEWYVIFRLVPMINLYAKFNVSIFTCYEDMIGYYIITQLY